MHEQTLMTGLMRQVREIAAAEGAQRVVKVTVWLGRSAICRQIIMRSSHSSPKNKPEARR